jgi:phosphoenolpyruvate carboxykinase (ATP)
MNPAAQVPSTATNIPLQRPISPGPFHSDFIRQQVAKQRSSNYHSSSLKMITQSVNRTALHPGGVQYVILPLCHRFCLLT